MIYNKISNIISAVTLAFGLAFFVLFIISMKLGAIPDNYFVDVMLKSFALSDMPSKLFLFCSSVMQIIVGVLGINIKKGTGAAGACVLFGIMVVIIKFFDIMTYATMEETPVLQLVLAVIYFVMYIVFIFCAAKQWDTH